MKVYENINHEITDIFAKIKNKQRCKDKMWWVVAIGITLATISIIVLICLHFAKLKQDLDYYYDEDDWDDDWEEEFDDIDIVAVKED